MGNHSGKDSHDTTASPLDFFHTAPTTPSEARPSAMASSPAEPRTPSPATAPPATAPIADQSQKLCAPSEWAVISMDRAQRSGTNVGEAAGGEAAGCGGGCGGDAEQSWQERDSGLEPQAAEERAGEEMALVLLSLVEHYRASLGLTPDADVTTGAVELLRRLITQRDELIEEVDELRETLRKERLEWQQFQCDLQVAVSVADRLRVEAEQALGSLRESHRAAEERLAEALGRRRREDGQLEGLRAERDDVRGRLSAIAQQQQEELSALRNEDVRDAEEEKLQDLETKNVEEPSQNETNQEADAEVASHDPESANGSDGLQLTGKGVAEGYLCSLAALERKKERQRDPRRIAALSERSWSLSRLALPTDLSDDTSKTTRTTLPLCKREEPQKERRRDRILQRQGSWSSFDTGKQEERRSSDCIKSQDGFSALLRHHGGSRRNSLLRWCQSRTQGYKNIEITNFSRSWEDGLALCAVYHTYVPTRIPYDALNPADKVENLDLAFKTGESVGITATLTAEEMLKADGPDWQKVLGYVESIFRHFEM